MTALLKRDEFLEVIAPIDSVSTVAGQDKDWKFGVEEVEGKSKVVVDVAGRVLPVTRDGLEQALQKVPGLGKSAVAQWPAEMLIDTVNWFYENGHEETRGLTHDGSLIGFTRDSDAPVHRVSAVLERIEKKLPKDSYMFSNVRAGSIHEVAFGLVTPAKEAQPKVGDVVQAGVWCFHSPTARRNPEISSFVNRLACTNGMIASRSLSKFSWRATDEVDYLDWVEDSTVTAWESVDLEFDALTALTQQRLNGHAHAVLEDLFERHRVPSSLRSRVVDAVVDEADGTMYGIAQAFNRAANSVEDPMQMRGLLMVTGDIAAQDERCGECFRAL